MQRIVAKINPKIAQVDLDSILDSSFVRNLETSGFLAEQSEVILARAASAFSRRRFGRPQDLVDMGIAHELDNSGFNANGIKHDKRSRPLLAHTELSGQEVRQIRHQLLILHPSASARMVGSATEAKSHLAGLSPDSGLRP